MDEGSDKGAGDGVAKKAESQATESNLPVVWSPKLDASAGLEGETATSGADEAAAATSDEAAKRDASEAAAAAPPRSWRFAQLAATIAIAAALGSFVGSLTASGVGHVAPEAALTTNTTDTTAMLRALKAQVAELTAMKSSLDGAVRNANSQFATISDRLDRVEKTAAAPSTQLTHIADAVDRLGKVSMAPETTGSIGTPAAPAAAGDPKITDRIVQDWLVQDVHGDRALVESRNGGLFDVGAGSVLPGLGRVEGVKRQDGQWVVVTARGLITSGR